MKRKSSTEEEEEEVRVEELNTQYIARFSLIVPGCHRRREKNENGCGVGRSRLPFLVFRIRKFLVISAFCEKEVTIFSSLIQFDFRIETNYMVLQFLREEELMPKDYWSKQTFLNPRMRRILHDWLMEVRDPSNNCLHSEIEASHPFFKTLLLHAHNDRYLKSGALK